VQECKYSGSGSLTVVTARQVEIIADCSQASYVVR
jgi:hypothetical protein